MSTGKKLMALTALVVVGLVLIYAIDKANLKKAETEGPELANGLLVEPVQEGGKTYFVPSDRLFEYGVDVPELRDPKYVSVSEADEILADGIEGISIEVDGVHYFYSYQILNWHQIVDATFGDLNLMITHDPLTYSDRVYLGAGFEHANLVYDNNAVLKDQNGDLWSQQRGIMIAGDRDGGTLESYPYLSIEWGTWKDLHEDGQVLSSDTGLVRDYTRHPFGAYDENDFIYFPLSTIDTRIADKWIVDGLEINGDAVAFVRTIMLGKGVDNLTIGGTPIVAMYDQELGLTRVFESTHDDQNLTFTYDFKNDVFRDEQTGSTWNADGVAVRGDLEGVTLTSTKTTQQFWFSWATQYPNTTISHIDAYVPPADENEIDLDLTDFVE